MAHSFKATDEKPIDLSDSEIALILQLIDAENVTWRGDIVHLAEELSVIMNGATAGLFELSHDHLTALDLIINKATFNKAARPVAAGFKRKLLTVLQSFYKGPT